MGMIFDEAMGNSRFERKERDFYPTPEEVTFALIPHLIQEPFGLTSDNVIWECACGTGEMSQILKTHFKEVIPTDINWYGYGYPGIDFYKVEKPYSSIIITNPPYSSDAEKFVRKGLELTKPYNGIVCMLLRNEWDCAKTRNDLFTEFPFAKKIVLLWRPRWFDYIPGDAQPRHNFAWFCWNWNYSGPPTVGYAPKPKGYFHGF